MGDRVLLPVNHNVTDRLCVLEGAFLVVAATNDAQVNGAVERGARSIPVLVLRADSCEHSDFTFAADGVDPALAPRSARGAVRIQRSVPYGQPLRVK